MKNNYKILFLRILKERLYKTKNYVWVDWEYLQKFDICNYTIIDAYSSTHGEFIYETLYPVIKNKLSNSVYQFILDNNLQQDVIDVLSSDAAKSYHYKSSVWRKVDCTKYQKDRLDLRAIINAYFSHKSISWPLDFICTLAPWDKTKQGYLFWGKVISQISDYISYIRLIDLI